VTDTHRTSDFIALKVAIEDELIPTSKVVENQHTLSSKVCRRLTLSPLCDLNICRGLIQIAHIF
jgi:hypothetical protein